MANQIKGNNIIFTKALVQTSNYESMSKVFIPCICSAWPQLVVIKLQQITYFYYIIIEFLIVVQLVVEDLEHQKIERCTKSGEQRNFSFHFCNHSGFTRHNGCPMSVRGIYMSCLLTVGYFGSSVIKTIKSCFLNVY